jgi:hypothetical protein
VSGVAELQAQLAELLQRRRALDTDPTVRDQAARIATGNDRLSPAEQLELYREQFWLRHTGSLVEDFEGLGGILGQHDWERLVEDYLAAYPPRSFSLRDLGDRLPAFVEQSTWLPHHALAVDMARVEWAYIEVFDAADATPLDPAKLASIPEQAWESARLVLSPALRLLEVGYPVAALRRAIRHKDPFSLPGAAAQKLVVYRDGARNLQHQVVSPGAFALLQALASGQALVPACQAAMAEVPDEAPRIEAELTAWFQDWAARAWVVDVLV